MKNDYSGHKTVVLAFAALSVLAVYICGPWSPLPAVPNNKIEVSDHITQEQAKAQLAAAGIPPIFSRETFGIPHLTFSFH